MKYAVAFIAYNPSKIQIKNINKISSRHDVYVYENSENIEDQAYSSDIHLLKGKGNNGMATALNALVEYARRDDRTHIITMDQDSVIDDQFIEQLIRTNFTGENVIIVSPVHFGNDNVYDSDLKSIDDGTIEVLTTMTSGNLLNIDLAVKNGGFEEKYFIDYVDHEFCLRANRNGYRVLVNYSIKMNHSLGGSRKPALIFGIRFTPTFHNSLRRAYMTRNRIDVWLKYRKVYPKWVFKDIMRFGKELIGIIIFEAGKFEKIGQIIRGISLFLKKDWGKIDNNKKEHSV